MHPSEEKERLRTAIKERLERYPQARRHAESRSICRRIIENLPRSASAVAGYYPLQDEANLGLFLREALQRKLALSLPCFESGKLVFRLTSSLGALTSGAFSIPEPPHDAPMADALTLDLVLVPGRAFDRKGNRLGRGNGGYDIWIASQRKRNSRTLYWGVALECQLVDRIPVEAHDQTLDAIVTARGLIRIDN